MTAPSTSAAAFGPAALSDADLARCAAGGDPGAFESIMRRHNRLLFRTARSVLRDDAEAEDALQEAYLRAWRALPSFRAEARLSTWLVRIVLNEALGRLRRRGAQVIPLASGAQSAPDFEPADGPVDEDPDRHPEHQAMRAEMRRLMEARIDRLPESFRAVFVLRAVEELSVEEVSAALELPPATVRTRYFRARGLLREGLSRGVALGVGDGDAFAGPRCDRSVAGVLAKLASGASESP